MSIFLSDTTTLPAEQQAIWAKCFHPTGEFIDFEKEQIESCVPHHFEEQVRRYPNRLAVKSRSHQLSYQELNQAANRVARAILALHSKGEEPIALLLDQGAPLLAPILGVLKTGNFYVPLDPDYPLARTRYLLEDSRAGLIVTNGTNLALATELAENGIQLLNVDEIPTSLSGDNLGLSISPDAYCHILYTSGTTGQPKGVLQNHRNLLHHILHFTQTLHISPDDRLTLLASITGQAITNIYNALLKGAALFPLNVKKEGVAALAPWLIQKEITIYTSASPLFRNFIETLTGEEKFPTVRIVRLASQTVFRSDVELYKKHFSPECIFVNGLSSTEATRISNYFIEKDSQITTSEVPLGYAVADKEISLLDEGGNEVDFNQVGEIVVKSRYLNPGYWGKPEFTRDTFQLDPEGGNRRIFRTGDLGRMLPDGCLEHLGRKDFQVKVRGNRVEISGIEAALLGLDTVKEAVVVARADETGNQRLTAYIVPTGQSTPSIGSLRAFLTETLPVYMVPPYFVLMDALPQLPGGKVDRQALPPPGSGRPELPNQFVRSRSTLERELSNVWAQVLGIDRVGAHDDFLDLGGDSLLAATLMVQIEKVFQNKLPLAALIQASTVAKMAVVLRHEKLAIRDSSLVPIQTHGDKPPFFCVHAVGGHVFGFTTLARHLGEDQPLYGLESPGRDGEQPALKLVEDMATLYLSEIRKVQPHGPYFLGAFSWGGRVAFEMAQKLHANGEEVALLAMFDSGCPVPANAWKRSCQTLRSGGYVAQRALHHACVLLSLKPSAQRSYLKEKAEVVRRMPVKYSPVTRSNTRAGRRYVPKPYPGSIDYFWANDRVEDRSDRRRGWWQWAEGGVELHRIPGGHTTFLLEPYVQTLAKQLKEVLEQAQKNVIAR